MKWKNKKKHNKEGAQLPGIEGTSFYMEWGGIDVREVIESLDYTGSTSELYSSIVEKFMGYIEDHPKIESDNEILNDLTNGTNVELVESNI